MHDNPYAAPQAQVRSPADDPTPPRSGKQLVLDVLRGLRYFLIRGIPAAAVSMCLFMMTGNAFDDRDWGPVIQLEPSAFGLFALAGATAYLPAGLCAGVLAGLLRPSLRRSRSQHAIFSAAVCLPIGLLEWMLFSVSSTASLGVWLHLLFVAPLVPIPLLLWLFARPQHPRQRIGSA